MIKPIKKVEDINPELIYKMTRDCMSPEWIKDFYTSKMNESNVQGDFGYYKGKGKKIQKNY